MGRRGITTYICAALLAVVASSWAEAQSPDTISDLVLWLDASDINGDGSTPPDGSLISSWIDKSNSGSHASEPDAARQPTLQYDAFGCRAGLYFDNLARGLSGQIARPTGQEFTVFMVASMGPSNNGQRNAFMEINSPGASIGMTPRSIFFQTHVWQRPLLSPISLGGLQVLRWTESAPSANFSVYADGVANTVNGTKTWGVVGANSVTYHLADDSTGGDEMEDGYINEVLFYDRILTAQEVSDVEAYLSGKWLNQPVCDPADLQVSKAIETAAVGAYRVPGEEVTYTFTIQNDGGPHMDSGSIFLADAIPPDLDLWTGDFDTGNTGMGPIEFSEGGTGLGFSAATDFGVSFDTARPTGMSDCTDVPNGGYDPSVRYVCLQFSGVVADGDPPPVATIRFRAQIN